MNYALIVDHNELHMIKQAVTVQLMDAEKLEKKHKDTFNYVYRSNLDGWRNLYAKLNPPLGEYNEKENKDV